MRRLLAVTILCLTAACEGEPAGYCDENAGVVYCQGTTNCAFDPASIDCTMACANLGAACAAGCTSVVGCSGYSMATCVTGCDFAKDQACPNVSFGCYTTDSTCNGIAACIAERQ